MFPFGYNNTTTGQTFYARTGDPLCILPNHAIDLALFSSPPSQLRPVKNFLHEVINGAPSFDVQRTFSLGDVLMLIPVVRELERMGYDIHYRTFERYVPTLKMLGVKTAKLESTITPTIILDWVVERDHLEPALANMHRCEIFARAIGMTKIPRRWNWSCALATLPPIKDDWGEKPYVVFQGCGGAKQRGLSPATIQWTLNAMAKDGMRVLYIGEPMDLVNPDENIVKLQFQNSSLEELFSWIARAKCLLSMDSSPLWISHFTRTPVIAILGPSRPAQRISAHPLYPEGVMALTLNQELNCKPCFEQAAACDHSFACLHNITGDRLYEMAKPYLMKYWLAEETQA